jgi:hypothetical protein
LVILILSISFTLVTSPARWVELARSSIETTGE